MEGILLVPPDRGTIIGRALWKPRYVVIGGARRDPQGPTAPTRDVKTAGRTQAGRTAAARGPLAGQDELPFLSIYKAKTESEPMQQFALSSVTECQVQMASHRKQGPVLPTLVVQIAPDPATDKMRRRRSSRAAGLTSSKESAGTTLWFRTGVVDDHFNLNDWSRYIQQLRQQDVVGPMSPITPSSPTFVNPFAPRSREAADYQQRPGSGNPGSRAPLCHKNSNQTQSSRERDRPVTYSESPSLRSRRSDLSHASSMNPSHMGFAMPMPHPADLPSPATTIAEYQGEFIEGWTSAQGRSSTVSSPVRGRDSVSSQAAGPGPHVIDSSSPPIPRETILDRAFQLRCIPGSERDVPGEEKLSSLARFDALMREVDQKRSQPNSQPSTPNDGMKSAWDLDEDSEPESQADDEEEDGDDGKAGEHDPDDPVHMTASAQRALDFIASRHKAEPAAEGATSRGPAKSNAESLRALHSGYSHLRPHTGYSTSRPAIAQRTYSQSHLVGLPMANTATLDIPSSSSGKTSEDGVSSCRSAEKRQSISSIKRLSFTEFTKRLGSTSSLLLAPTNVSSGTSSRGSNGELDAQQITTIPKGGSLSSRGPPAPPPPPPGITAAAYAAEWEKRCGWRGSVGVFGSAEGGFL